MPDTDPTTAAQNAKIQLFPDTRWSLVARAQVGSESVAHRALGELCQTYWYPVYAFARSRGLSPQDAEDSTQALFERFLERDGLGSVSPDHGRLRAYFLASMKNLLTTRWRSSSTQKRGGNQPHVSIDRDWAEGTLSDSLTTDADGDAENLFDRSWAYAVLAAVSQRLSEHYAAAGKGELYEAIKASLEGDGRYGASADIATTLGLTEEGVRSAVFKLRRRFREFAEEEISDTCSTPDDTREEIAHLCRILAS